MSTLEYPYADGAALGDVQTAIASSLATAIASFLATAIANGSVTDSVVEILIQNGKVITKYNETGFADSANHPDIIKYTGVYDSCLQPVMSYVAKTSTPT